MGRLGAWGASAGTSDSSPAAATTGEVPFECAEQDDFDSELAAVRSLLHVRACVCVCVRACVRVIRFDCVGEPVCL